MSNVGSPVSEKTSSRQLGEDGASGRVAQVRMHARYHEVAVLADFLFALGAIMRSHY
jgi:hypothetical protein